MLKQKYKIFDYKNNSKIYSIVFIILFLFFHLLYINTPFVNYEWAYRLGTQSIVSSNENLLKLYFNNQANTIIYSVLSAVPLSIIGDQYATYRIISLFGGILTLVLLIRHNNFFLIICVGLNPLIWIYSGRAYSEVLSVGIMMLALELSRRGLLKGILGGISAVIKYNSIIVVGSYWGLKWFENLLNNKRVDWRDINLLAMGTCVSAFTLFLLIYYLEFGIWIMPEHFKNTMKLDLINSLNNFFSYGFYLGSLFILTIPFLLKNTSIYIQMPIILISLILTFINENIGEMGFGVFDYVFGSNFIFIVKLVGFWNFIMCVIVFWSNKKYRIIILTIIFYIIIISFTRPAQRYLIFIIPLWAILVCNQIYLGKFVKCAYVSALLGMNIFATIFQINNARAAEDIELWAQKNNIFVNSRAIYPHTGIFSHHNVSGNITVSLVARPENEILTKQTVSVFGYLIKTYYVIKEK